MSELKNQIGSIWLEIKETVMLNLDYARLTGAEKLATLLSMCVIGFVAIILVSIVIFLISAAMIVLLSHSTGIFGACMIMAGIYAVLLILLFALRRQVIVNPIARFVSTLFMK